MSFAIGIALARILVPHDFGLLVTVQIFTGFVGLVAGGGLGQALIRAKAVELPDFHTVFSAQLAIGVVLYTAFFLSSPLIASAFSEPIYTDLVRLSAVSFLMRPFANVPQAMLQRSMRFRAIAIVRLLALIATGASSIALALLGYGVWALVLGGIIGTVVTILSFLPLTGARLYRLRFELARLRLHGTYGIKVSANDVVSYLRSKVPNLIISYSLGPTAVGLFNKADSLARMPFQTFGGAVYEPIFRALAKEQENLDTARYIYFRSVSLLILYTLPLYIGMGWVADSFIYTVYGENWVPSAPVLQILASAGLLYCVGHTTGAVFGALNRLGTELRIQLEMLVALTIVVYIGLQWGIEGAAAGMVFALTYATVRSTTLTLKLLHAPPRKLLRAVTPGLFLNCILLATLIAVEQTITGPWRQSNPALHVLVTAVVGGGVYVACFLFIPPSPLRSEALKWRQKLRLTT